MHASRKHVARVSAPLSVMWTVQSTYGRSVYIMFLGNDLTIWMWPETQHLNIHKEAYAGEKNHTHR